MKLDGWQVMSLVVLVGLPLYGLCVYAQDKEVKNQMYNNNHEMVTIDEMANKHQTGHGDYGIVLWWDPLEAETYEGSGIYRPYEGNVLYTSTVVEFEQLTGRNRAVVVNTGPDRAFTYWLPEPGCVVHTYIAYSDDGDETPSEAQTVCISLDSTVTVRPSWEESHGGDE